ncbi:MAG: hypothetical protein LUH00_06560 [Lachnospiraceae bacterium]|nr:hypothetical protein [Lachnospiraceae bacterium]
MFNILINNLSTVRRDIHNISQYRLNIEETVELAEEQRAFEGIYTNEPITHALVRRFVTENKGEKLDLIYSLTSDLVRNSKVFSNENEVDQECLNLYAQYLDMENSQVLELTHYQFYQELIHKIIVDEYCLFSKNELSELGLEMTLEKHPISNNPDTKEIHAVVLAMAREVIEVYDSHQGQCRLYMDYTGGDRTVSTVMIALTKMLEERGIKIDHIWAVSGFRPSGVNEITEKIEVNYIFDLISGLQEFNHYGRADILNDFLRKSEEKQSIVLSDQAHKVQDKISDLADRIQLCKSRDIVNGIGQLVNAIDSYKKNDTVHDQMFDYLIEDINKNYLKIAENRTIPNIISWCLDKNLIQQAVTMYAELLPEVLVKYKILYYDKQDWNVIIKKQNGKTIYGNEVRNYISYGYCKEEEILNAGFSTKGYLNFREEYSYMNYYIWKGILGKTEYRRNGYYKDYQSYERKADFISAYIFSASDDRRYVQVKAGLRQQQLKGLLMNYMIFKTEIRHVMNHADAKFSVKNLQKTMVWTDKERMETEFSCNSDMTVHLLTEIMRDLLLQLSNILGADQGGTFYGV